MQEAAGDSRGSRSLEKLSPKGDEDSGGTGQGGRWLPRDPRLLGTGGLRPHSTAIQHTGSQFLRLQAGREPPESPQGDKAHPATEAASPKLSVTAPQGGRIGRGSLGKSSSH